MFVIDIANIKIAIEHRYSAILGISQDYITDGPPEFSVSVNDDDIQKERELYDLANPEGEEIDEASLETIAIYRKIAELIWQHDAFVFHGAAIVNDGKAYLFGANSGVGKTTHIRLWFSNIEGTRVLNGDKPVIRLVDGRAYISGTPWRGKENYGEPGFYPLAGIAFIERASENSAYKINADDSLLRFLQQVYIPKSSAAASAAALRIFDKLLNSVPLIVLKCNMEPEAAHVARQAFSDAAKF